MESATPPTYHHPVRPDLADQSGEGVRGYAAPAYSDAGPPPRAYPPAGPPPHAYSAAGLPPADPPRGGAFAEHKIAIFASVVVLLILIVALWVYLTRRGDKKKSETPGGAPVPPGLPPTETAAKMDMAEMTQLRDQRRAAAQLEAKQRACEEGGANRTPPAPAAQRPRTPGSNVFGPPSGRGAPAADPAAPSGAPAAPPGAPAAPSPSAAGRGQPPAAPKGDDGMEAFIESLEDEARSSTDPVAE